MRTKLQTRLLLSVVFAAIHALVLTGNRDAAQFWNAVGWRMRENLTMVSAEMEALPVN